MNSCKRKTLPCGVSAQAKEGKRATAVIQDPDTVDRRAQRALDHLVHILYNPPVLGNLSFVLHTDASEQGLDAVLYQRQGGKLRVIAYWSGTLTPAERTFNLHSGKLEFLALKWAICEKFRGYLFYVPHFLVYTENNPLTYVMSTAKLNAISHQWVCELTDFLV